MTILNLFKSIKNYITVFGAVAILGISSCSDDTVTSEAVDINASFPTSYWSYWIYQKQEIDSTGKLNTTIIGYDSATAKVPYSLENKSAVDFISYHYDANNKYLFEYDTETFSKENGLIYSTPNTMLNIIGKSFDFPINLYDPIANNTWYLTLQDKQNWEIMNISSDELIPGTQDFPVTMSAKLNISINGNKEGSEELTILNSNYKTNKFSMNAVCKVNLVTNEEYNTGTGISIPANSTLATYTLTFQNSIWISEGVGIVKKEESPQSIKFLLNPTFKSITETVGFNESVSVNKGMVYNLVRHDIQNYIK